MTPTLYDRILGCLVGVAAGDALGMPTSFLPPHIIKWRYGRVTDFVAPAPKHIYHAGYQPGQVTDDTEQTIRIARTLLASKHADPDAIAETLVEWFHVVGGRESDAVGPSSMRALTAIEEGQPLKEAGKRGDTNGASMRIAPVGILNARRAHKYEAIVDDVYRVCLPTHGSTLAVSGASAMACGIACALGSGSIAETLQAARAGAVQGASVGFPVIGPSVARRIGLAIRLVQQSTDIDEAATELYEVVGAGVATAESVPAAFGIFLAGQGDPESTILAAVNMGGDADTVASMAGALVGAYAGVGALPPTWQRTVERVNDLDLEVLAEQLLEATDWWGNI